MFCSAEKKIYAKQQGERVLSNTKFFHNLVKNWVKLQLSSWK